jgi:hypothetical protein
MIFVFFQNGGKCLRFPVTDKDVVVGVARHLKPARRDNQMAMVPDQLQQLQTQPFANRQFGTRQHIPVFLEDRRGNIQASRLCNGQQEGRALQAFEFQRRGNHDISIEHQTHRKHQRFFFSDLATLMT